MSKSTSIDDLPTLTTQPDAPIFEDRPELLTQQRTLTPPAPKTEWYTLATRPDFLKAVVLAFVVIMGVLFVPVDEYVTKQATFLAKIPHSAFVIKAFVAAAVITFLRPPHTP
jgi:hypothetical protein